MPVLHFEIQAADVDRAKAFYGGLFGWSFAAPPGFPDYWLAAGEGIGEGLPVSGAIMARQGAAPEAGSPPRGATLTIPVADADERFAWALGHGGAEAMAPFDIQGVGRVAYVEDGEGNIIGMIQAATGGN